MTVHHSTARALATDAEWAFLSSSYSRAVAHKSMTPARLQQKVARAQKLRDKYRDRDVPVKEAMFADAMARFEARLAELTPTLGARLERGVVTRPPRESDAVVPDTVRSERDPWLAHESGESTSERAQSKSSRGARRALKFAGQSAQAHQGHVGSRTRHRQAGRDAR